MNIQRYTIPFLLLAIGIITAGCGESSTGIVSGSLPRGEWQLEKLDSQGGIERRHLLNLLLTDTLGTLTDTFTVNHNGVWEIDSTSTTLLYLQPVGDGYQRVIEVHNVGTLSADTVLRYWYFFKRNDSLYSYTGMRFSGSNPGVKGMWSTEEQDSTLLREMIHLNFLTDSVIINHRSAVTGDSDSTFAYHTHIDTLTINGGGNLFGDRFDVVPGFALYITTHAGEGLAQKK